jgi:type IV secretion system protein VirB9
MHRRVRRAHIGGGVLAALLVLPCAHPDTVPDPGKVDGRVRVVPYLAEDVYRLRGYAGYQIDLEFEPGETFTGLSAGDLQSLAFAAEANHLFVKPKVVGGETNLTVLTNRRAYHFDYAATARRPDSDPRDVIYVLRFTYPPPADAQSKQDVERKLASTDSAARNYDYWYRGSAAVKPVGAWDDGVQTRLRFGPTQELPAIFLRNEDGSESLVNFTIDGGEVVVHRVAHRLVVRRGKLTGCIVNEAFAGAGARLDSGTVTPAVERIVRGGPP